MNVVYWSGRWEPAHLFGLCTGWPAFGYRLTGYRQYFRMGSFNPQLSGFTSIIFSESLHDPYVENWFLGIQRELP